MMTYVFHLILYETKSQSDHKSILLSLLYYPVSMEFTELVELNNLIVGARSYRANMTDQFNSQDNKSNGGSYEALYTQNTNIHQLIEDIDFHAKSLVVELHNQAQLSTRIKARSEVDIIIQNESHQINQQLFKRREGEQTRSSTFYRNSNIFKKSFQKNPYKKTQKTIKVFYFGAPTFKYISYDKQTLVQDLIQKAIVSYLQDQQLDKSKVKTTLKEAYIMRLLDDDDSCKPDLSLQPLDPKKKIRETFLEAVVLMQNNKIQFGFEQQVHLKRFESIKQTNKINIRIYNQHNIEIDSMNLEPSASAAEIYNRIESNHKNYMCNKYYLTDSNYGDYEVSKQIMVSQIQSNRLYIKIRQYADQPQHRKSQSEKQTENNQQVEEVTPMSLAQASMYEEFSVVKINKRGNRQDRILGIDQNKIYNFDKDFKISGKQVSIISRLFGSKMDFGTKNPERLVKDIISIHEIQNLSQIVITCKADGQIKNLIFQVEKVTKIRILKKLRFLMKYLQESKR